MFIYTYLANYSVLVPAPQYVVGYISSLSPYSGSPSLIVKTISDNRNGLILTDSLQPICRQLTLQ